MLTQKSVREKFVKKTMAMRQKNIVKETGIPREIISKFLNGKRELLKCPILSRQFFSKFIVRFRTYVLIKAGETFYPLLSLMITDLGISNVSRTCRKAVLRILDTLFIHK